MYKNIVDPENKKSVIVNTAKGKEILDNYLKFLEEKTGEEIIPKKADKYSPKILSEIAMLTLNYSNSNKNSSLYNSVLKVPYRSLRDKIPEIDDPQLGGVNEPTLDESLEALKKIINKEKDKSKSLEEQIKELQKKLDKQNAEFEQLRKKVGDFVINEQGDIVLSVDLRLRQYTRNNVYKVAKFGISFCKKNKENPSEFCQSIISLIDNNLPGTKKVKKEPTTVIGMAAKTVKDKINLNKKKAMVSMKKQDNKMKLRMKKQQQKQDAEQAKLDAEMKRLNQK
jgi:hypothetical protein